MRPPGAPSLLALLSIATAAGYPAPPLPPKWPMSGITFTGGRYCPEVTLGSASGLASLEHLETTGANWVSIVVTTYQHSINTTSIFPLYNASQVPPDYYTYVTESDADVVAAIRKAKALGLKVMLKPHLDPVTDNAPLGKTWRGDIGKFFNASQWDDWFESYWERILSKYGHLAAREKVDMLSMNCELITANNQTSHWREMVRRTRQVFSGMLTTAPNGHGHQHWVDWFDVVDVIGVDLYDYVAGTTAEEMARSWQPYLADLEGLSAKFGGKPVVLTELGYCSGACDRTHRASPSDLEGQARHYEALFMAVANRTAPWFLGAFWWNWDTDPAPGEGDVCLNPAWKPAETVLRTYYRATKPRPPRPAAAPQCVGVGKCTH